MGEFLPKSYSRVLWLLFLLVFTVWAADTSRVMVYTIDLEEANSSALKKWTLQIVSELENQPNLVLKNVYEPELDTGLPNLILKNTVNIQSCKKVECAVTYAKEMGFDFALLPKINKRGKKYILQLSWINVSTAEVVYTLEKTFLTGRKEIWEALPELSVQSWEYFQKKMKIRKARNQEIDSTKINLSAMSVQLGEADTLTQHLQGTRLKGVLPDTLYASQSPYILTGNVVVSAEKDLLIEPGVKIFIGGEYTTFTVFGRIHAKGTAEKPITIQSGRKKTSPWDWDRILFRSRERSVLEYVTISHSNYGVVALGSAVSLIHCHLTKNSVRALYVEDSDVEIRHSRIDGGHLLGVQVAEFGEVLVERTKITGNHNAISVQKFGSLKMFQSEVEQNDRGLILVDSVALEMENVKIQKNRVGIVSNLAYPIRLFSGLRDNQSQYEVLGKENLSGLLEKPIEIREKRRIQLISRETAAESERIKKYQPGIRSEKDGGLLPGLLGNYSLGSEYHLPSSATNNTNQTAIQGSDSILPGEKYLQNKVIPGYYQTFSGYTSLELGKNTVDANFDFLWDQWGGLQWRNFTAKSKWGPQNFVLGDFSENNSEISMYSVAFRGLKYGLDLGRHRNGLEKLLIEGAFGETERPYDEGDRVLGSYEERKAEGSAVAQRLVGQGRIKYRPTENWDLDFRYIQSEDKRDTWLRPNLSRTAALAQEPLESRLLGFESKWSILKNRWEIGVEANLGTVDSLRIALNKSIQKWIENSTLTEIQANSLRELLQPTVKESVLNNNIGNALGLWIDSASLYTQLLNEQKADTTTIDSILEMELYKSRISLLDSIKKEVLSIENEIQEKMEEEKELGFRWGAQGWAYRFYSFYQWERGSLETSFLSIGSDFFTGGNPFLVRDRRDYGLNLSQDFTEKVSLSGQYKLMIEGAKNWGNGDNFWGFDIPESGEKPEFTHDTKWNLRWNIHPRIELQLGYDFLYKLKDDLTTLDVDTSELYSDPFFAADSGEATEVFRYNNTNLDRSSNALNEYRDLNPLGNLPLAANLENREIQDNLRLKSKYRISNSFTLGLEGRWKLTRDFSSFQVDSLLNRLPLQDTTFQKLGYYPSGEDEFRQDYDLIFQFRKKTWNNKFNLELGFNSKNLRNEKEVNWGFENQFKYEPRQKKLHLTFSTRLKMRHVKEDDTRFFVKDSADKKWYFYTTDTLGNQILSKDVKHSSSVSSTEPSQYDLELFFERFRKPTFEFDFNWDFLSRYNFTSRMYGEAGLSQILLLRPDLLEQQYQDFVVKATLFYSL